jgi:hypothetical protein
MDLPCFCASSVIVGELILEVGIVLRSVPSGNVCQGIYRVEIVDPLFFDQYILFLEEVCEE